MGIRANRNGVSIGALGLMLCISANPALATGADQEVASASSPTGATIAPSQITETRDIIVTARRRAERLQDAPVAVTAVTPLQVSALNLRDTRDLVRIAPMLGFTQGSTTKLVNFVVRGVGTFVNSDGLDQSVGVAFDGVSLARPGGSIADLIDIERVEVLEGPQGMLFGRNASAGLINIISRKPELGVLSGTGSVSYGSFNELKAEAAVNVPVGSTFAARLVGWESRHDGFVRDITTNADLGKKDSQGIRVRTKWAPTSALEINLMGEYIHADQDPAILTYREFTANTLGLRDYELGRGIIPGPRNEQTTSDRTLYNRSRSTALSAELVYDLGGPSLTVLGSYRNVRVQDRFDPPTTSFPGFVQTSIDDLRYKQQSVEARLTSAPSSRFNYVLGAIYYHFDLVDRYVNKSAGNVATPVSTFIVSSEQSRHYAAFGETNFEIVPSLRVIAGARYSIDRISGSSDKQYLDPPLTIIPALNGPGATFGPFSTASSVKDAEWSYRFGAQWNIAHDVMIYGTASRGYKAAGLDLAITLTPTIFNVNQLRVKPEISRNFEVGLRSQFLNRRLTINLTGFHEIFTNFQIASRLPVAATVFSLQNAKELQTTGASLSVEARPSAALSLSGSLAYVNARYTDFNNASCYPGEPTAPVGSPFAPDLCIGGVQSLNGKPLQSSPKLRANATARYETVEFIRNHKSFFQANVRYQSREFFNAVADPHEQQGRFATVNLTAGIGAENGSWAFSVYASNVLNQKFVARIIPGLAGATYAQLVSYDARARFGGTLNFAF